MGIQFQMVFRTEALILKVAVTMANSRYFITDIHKKETLFSIRNTDCSKPKKSPIQPPNFRQTFFLDLEY
jgi:hypothetical protein